MHAFSDPLFHSILWDSILTEAWQISSSSFLKMKREIQRDILPQAAQIGSITKIQHFFFSFYGHTWGICKFPGWGLNWNCSCWPTTQSQQCQIQAASGTHTTACSNAEFFIHWIKHTSSQILCQVLNLLSYNENSKIQHSNSNFEPSSCVCEIAFLMKSNPLLTMEIQSSYTHFPSLPIS